MNAAHTSMKILPYVELSLEKHQRLSAQQVSFQVSDILRANLFFDTIIIHT